MRSRIIFLVGPTGIGKSETAVALAKKIMGEIICCDSMQIYKGMDILTSKPPIPLRKKVPHHLIDFVPVSKEYDVSKYRRLALKKIKELIKKKKLPILVGGTGLYMSILVDGIFSFKTANKEIRKRLYKEAQSRGSIYLHNRLKRVDPEAAIKIHPNDTKRIVRALEVFEATGKPISYMQKRRKGLAQNYDVRIFCLNMELEKLYKRIDQRVEQMFARGLIGEAKNLLKSKLSRTARFAIGIRELKGYFDAEFDLERAKSLIKRNTRLYAKRQLTWFRKDKRIKWINLSGREKPNEIAERILSLA